MARSSIKASSESDIASVAEGKLDFDDGTLRGKEKMKSEYIEMNCTLGQSLFYFGLER